MKAQKNYLLFAVIGAVICFIGDNLLGNFYPAEGFGNAVIFPAFSYDWGNADSIRFLLGGALGVIALLMMYLGYYSIYMLIRDVHDKFAKIFIVGAFIFTAVGTLYHCVFAITAFLYNELKVADITNAELFSEKVFNSFIFIAFPAAAGFGIVVIILFIITVKKMINNSYWLVVVNPLIIMLVCILLSKLLPRCAMVNGVFGWGQQSIALFFTFLVYYINYNDLLPNRT